MSWRMATDSEIRALSTPDKMFAYADSYLRGSLALCEELAQAFRCTWADGAVVLMMSAHATELFLKGMLLKRMKEQEVWAYGHNLERLASAFHFRFSEPEFAWEIPFRTEYLSNMTAEEIAALAPQRDAPPSILYRYPVDKTGEDWRGVYGFEPNMFVPVLRGMKNDFARLRSAAA